MKLATLFSLAAVVLALAADISLIQPKELVDRLSAKPTILYVGPNFLYRSKHIPGAVYAGPGSTAAGLAVLKEAAEKLPRDREIVIYCGCCPWNRCPNVKPAVDLLGQMGFKRVKTLHLPDNFKTNWIDRGYPVE